MVDIGGGGILRNKVVICPYRASTLYDTILTASRSICQLDADGPHDSNVLRSNHASSWSSIIHQLLVVACWR